MKKNNLIKCQNRRDVLLGLGAAGVAAWLTGLSGQAFAQKAPTENGWQQALEKLAGGAKPAPGKISLQFPDMAVPGSLVPFTVTVDSPMAASDFVKAVHLFSTANASPGVASYYFTPLSGKAEVSSRIRLDKSQNVVALAQMSDGKVYMAERKVSVLISGNFLDQKG